MPRSFAAAFRADFEAPHAQQVVLIFVKLYSRDWATPIYVVNDVVNYTWNGIVWTGFPFDIELLEDLDKPPRGKLTVQNVDRVLGESIQGLVYSPYIDFYVMSSGDWNTAIDVTSNSRLPIGTPTVEMQALMMKLWEITVTPVTVEATFGPDDVTQEFWPQTRCTKQNTPGLFR